MKGRQSAAKEGTNKPNRIQGVIVQKYNFKLSLLYRIEK